MARDGCGVGGFHSFIPSGLNSSTISSLAALKLDKSSRIEIEIGNFICAKHADKIKAAGFAPIEGVMEAYVTTTLNYAALLLLAAQPTISIWNTAIKKTQTRCTVENSLISSIALVLVAAAMCYTPTTEDTSELERESCKEQVKV